METRQELIDVLKEAMTVEYGALFLLPQHIARVADDETRRQLKLILEVELEHAEKTARLIYELGGEPDVDLPHLKPRSEVRRIVETQIENERQAIEIYSRAAALCHDPGMSGTLADLHREEEGHLRVLERALARL